MAPHNGAVTDFKCAVRRSFDIASNTYDAEADLHAAVAERLLAAIRRFPCPTDQVLDVGCGTGVLTRRLLLLQPRRLSAIDLSSGMCEKTRDTLRSLGATGDRAEVLVADMESLPYETGRFDIVASSFAVQWAADLRRAVDECLRVVRRGGLVALAVPVRGSLPELSAALARICPGRAVGHRFPTERRVLDCFRGAARLLSIDVGHDILTAPTARELFRRLRRMGVQTAGRTEDRLAPSVALQLAGAYRPAETDEPARATFRTLLLVARPEGAAP